MKRDAGGSAVGPTTNVAGDSEKNIENMPQKRFYRSRAHCNPLSHNDAFTYPKTPAEINWKEEHFPTSNHEFPMVRHVDIGCGFGGLTVSLASIFPDKPVVGFEIRAKVCEYVRLRIAALRAEHPTVYSNASCVRTNCMRYLPNYFVKGQLEKMFFCFPDPHFKAKNHRRRIVSDVLLSEYAYFLAPNAKLYTVTDVKELHDWHVEKCSAHPSFVQVATGSREYALTEAAPAAAAAAAAAAGDSTGTSDGAAAVVIKRTDEGDAADVDGDPCVEAILADTEESKKVARNKGAKYYAVYRRLTLEEELAKQPQLACIFD